MITDVVIVGVLVLTHTGMFVLGWFFRKDNPKAAATVDPITNKVKL